MHPKRDIHQRVPYEQPSDGAQGILMAHRSPEKDYQLTLQRRVMESAAVGQGEGVYTLLY